MTAIRQFNNDEFRPATFVVDPAGCGCTDCIMGYSTPADELDLDQIFAAMGLGFELIDRRNSDEKEKDPTFPFVRSVDPAWIRIILAMKK